MTKNVTLLMTVSVNNWLVIVIYNSNINFGCFFMFKGVSIIRVT